MTSINRNARVEQVGAENQIEAVSYLESREETSQFLLNNLEALGPALTAHHNSGNFKLLRDQATGKVVGVFCHSRRGTLLAQTEAPYPELILEACRAEGLPLTGFIGVWDSIEPIVAAFRKKNPDYRPSYESKEILYSRLLSADDKSLLHDPRVRLLRREDFPQWETFSAAYMKELGVPDDLDSAAKKKSFEAQVDDRVWWGLFAGNELLSRTALNSKGKKLGQVGGVFTPVPKRKQGFSKATMLHMLKDCRDLHGHSKSILFTGENDFAARKLYESIGYTPIGSFALILG